MNYEEQIKELKEQIAKLEAKMKESKETKVSRWKPENDNIYWHITTGGNFRCWEWENDDIDEFRYLTQNCFKTEEEAEEHKKEIETYFKFKNYVEKHSEPLNWNDDSQTKFFIYFNYNAQSVRFSDSYFCRKQGTIYASSEQILKDAIDYIGGEEVAKRYLFGIKEEE